MTTSLVVALAGCGGGGGGDEDPPPPPPTAALSGSALYAERVSLSWIADEFNTSQAYALMVNGSLVTYTTQKAYLFTALPDTRYCFTVVVGALLPPLASFGVTGPTSNELCLTTPSLPPLASGWNLGMADLGAGGGAFPAIARRAADSVGGLYACNASRAGTSFFGLLGTRGMVLPTFSHAGDTCAVADNASFVPALDALTRSGSTVAYRQAVPSSGSWWSTGDSSIATDADAAAAVSIALDASQRPQVLYTKAGQAYWSQLDALGQWSLPELVGPGVAGWRSLAVAADGAVFAFLVEGTIVRVLRRGALGLWTKVYSTDGEQASQYRRGLGSIVASTGGGVRLAYRRAAGVGYVEWLGGASAWTETLVDGSVQAAAPAVAIGLAGEPLIAYGDEQENLRLSRRIAGQWQTVVIDALGDLARQTDIEVDAQGVVYILYSDEAGSTRVATGH